VNQINRRIVIMAALDKLGKSYECFGSYAECDVYRMGGPDGDWEIIIHAYDDRVQVCRFGVEVVKLIIIKYTDPEFLNKLGKAIM